jgi:hypothetical protein
MSTYNWTAKFTTFLGGSTGNYFALDRCFKIPLGNGYLPMQISYQISLSNMCIFLRTGNFYITTIWVNLNRKTVFCVQRPFMKSTCMCTVSSSWRTFSLEWRMSAH